MTQTLKTIKKTIIVSVCGGIGGTVLSAMGVKFISESGAEPFILGFIWAGLIALGICLADELAKQKSKRFRIMVCFFVGIFSGVVAPILASVAVYKSLWWQAIFVSCFFVAPFSGILALSISIGNELTRGRGRLLEFTGRVIGVVLIGLISDLPLSFEIHRLSLGATIQLALPALAISIGYELSKIEQALTDFVKNLRMF